MNSEKLVSWGAVLILFGIFSFVLPLFGRQFLILTAMGGGSVVGMVLIGIGVLLVFTGIKGTAQHELLSKTTAQQSNVPAVSRTIPCPTCKVNLRFHDTGELKCRCPDCKTTFRVDSGDRVYDTGCPWD